MLLIPETWDECLGLALRRWREVRGEGQVVIAARAGVSQSAWSRWEAGTAPLKLGALADAGVSLDGLVAEARRLAAAHGVPLRGAE